MQTSRRITWMIISALASLWVGSLSASAFDGTTETAANDKAPLKIFKNPQAALRAGLEGFKSGDVHSAIEAMKYAAAGGESLAAWKLGKMYADGDGLPHDDLKAYEYYSQIVENYDEDTADPRILSVVSSAFVAVGVYDLSGIPNSRVKPDVERAIEMFRYAATNFGDPNAQYNLAHLYLDGTVVVKDVRQAARWFYLAAEKGHVESQALLGQLLFTGRDGVQRQRGAGLMWLTLAREATLKAEPLQLKKNQWIVELYEKAQAAANDADKQMAAVYVADYRNKRN
ncbi:MAG: tetratricopeptide repeat protein [Beijerinckiaceae bacterium]